MPISPETELERRKFAALPSPPAVLIQLIDSCNQPLSDFEQLADIIQQDAALTAKVIETANSPFYRQWQEITDLQHLLVILGIRSVRTIAINSAVQRYFGQLGKAAGRSVERIWYHSLICAHCAKSLAELTAYPSPDEAYLAGLLHRLGQLALLQSYPEEYRQLLDRDLGGETLTQAELECVGHTSAAVAATLIDDWQLRSFIADAVRYQHEPASSILDSAQLVKLVNLACDLARQEQTAGNGVMERADLLFGINQSVLEQLLGECRQQAVKAARSLNIALPREQEERTAASHHEALGERIKQAALFGGAMDAMPDKADLISTLQQIQRNLGLLFPVTRSCFLLVDGEQQRLHPLDPAVPGDQPLNSLSFSLKTAESLAAQAFIEQRFLGHRDGEQTSAPPVGDRQLAHYLRCEGIIYLPLTAQERLGLIAVGVPMHEWATLNGQQTLLGLFAREAAQALLRQRETAAEQAQAIDDERAAIDLQARKVVHEANNPLGIINNYLHILGTKLGEDHPVQDELTIIREEIERVGRIILRIRDIPADAEQRQRTVNINQLIEDLNKLFQSSLFPSHNISSTLDLDRTLGEIRTRRGHMKQIVTNLVKNAVEAMPEGGKLTITTRDNAFLNGKAHIEIQVIDDGPGIPAQIMQQLFTPVTSTKDGTHSGLGLAIAKNLMDELSGHITCTSKLGQGTRFQLYLPRSGKH